MHTQYQPGRTDQSFGRKRIRVGGFKSTRSYWNTPVRSLIKVKNYCYLTLKTDIDPTHLNVWGTVTNDPEAPFDFNNLLSEGAAWASHLHTTPRNWAEVKKYYLRYRCRGLQVSARLLQTYAGDAGAGQPVPDPKNASCVTKPFIWAGRFWETSQDPHLSVYPTKAVFRGKNQNDMGRLGPWLTWGRGSLIGGNTRSFNSPFFKRIKAYCGVGAFTQRTKLDMHNQHWTPIGGDMPDEDVIGCNVGIAQYITDLTAASSPVIVAIMMIKTTHYLELGDPIPPPIVDDEEAPKDYTYMGAGQSDETIIQQRVGYPYEHHHEP